MIDAMKQDLRKAIDEAGSLRKFAAKHGFSATFVSFVVNGRVKFTKRLAEAIGYYRPENDWKKLDE